MINSDDDMLDLVLEDEIILLPNFVQVALEEIQQQPNHFLVLNKTKCKHDFCTITCYRIKHYLEKDPSATFCREHGWVEFNSTQLAPKRKMK